MLGASLAIMAPGALASLRMTASAVDVSNDSSGVCCKATLRWSYTRSGTLRPCGTPLQSVDPRQAASPTTISSAVMPQGVYLRTSISILIADVFYVHQTPFPSQWIDTCPPA